MVGAAEQNQPQIADDYHAYWGTVANGATYVSGGHRVKVPDVIAEDTDLTKVIGQNIRLGRQLANKMSQEELARRIGASDYRAISKLEHGHRKPGYHRLIRIAHELGQTVDWLLEPHEQ